VVSSVLCNLSHFCGISTKVMHVARTSDLCDWPHTHRARINKPILYYAASTVYVIKFVHAHVWYFHNLDNDIPCSVLGGYLYIPASWLCPKGNCYIQVPLYYSRLWVYLHARHCCTTCDGWSKQWCPMGRQNPQLQWFSLSSNSLPYCDLPAEW